MATVEAIYGQLRARVDAARDRLGRPLTLSEKVLCGHIDQPVDSQSAMPGVHATFDVDRVALQDALAQIVVLQFMVAGLDKVVVPTTIHCDHLIRAKVDARTDLDAALDDNTEIYEFLRAAAARYGMGFWEPGSGIIHQVVLENYAFPGGMMIGTDSHTPNAGGLGMIAIGVGGGDAIDAMTGRPFGMRWPCLIGVRLTGSLSGWSSPKDVILRVAELLTVSGGTGAVLEYFGPGVSSIAATGRSTICNMGAELGATTSIFPFDDRAATYLEATGRADIADAGRQAAAYLCADPAVVADPGHFFDEIIEIDLSSVVPMINGPDSPDRGHIVGEVGAWARANDVPTEISAALIGSCTNSSYQDLSRAASIARQARAHGFRAKVPLYVTPGSERVRATVERDGLLDDLVAIGGTVLANACGPCIGQWERTDTMDAARVNTIVNSFNRNFSRRNDGRSSTKAFVTSPEMVVAYALSGTLDFDPRTDALRTDNGIAITLDPPFGADVPSRGYIPGVGGYTPSHVTRADNSCAVSPTSDRLQLLTPFPAWDGEDYVDLPVLLKARGKCTTDAISAAGPWLRYRGHLENISANLYLGVVNAFTGATGTGRDPIDGATRSFPEIATNLANAGLPWCAIGDENYGEGSSREHAAMEPRYRGCVALIARSFARIHETNLKRQGVLALTFTDPATYGRIDEDDRISVLQLHELAPNRPIAAEIVKRDGTRIAFTVRHTMNDEELEWFRAGSALNVVRRSQVLRGSARHRR